MIKQVVNNNSIGPIGLMWVVLFALKLMHVVNWTWWVVVFFPLIAGLSITALMAVIALITGGLVWAFTEN